MAFLPNIPQPTDQLSVSQGNILNNFQILGAIAGNGNIGSATINATAGFNQINLANQGGTVPSFNGNNGLWVGNFAHDATTTTELWAQYNQGTGGTAGQYQYPISASSLSLTPTPATISVNGWSYLSSGILMKWGAVTNAAPVNIDTTSGGPAFKKIFNAQATLFNNSAAPYYVTVTAPPAPTISLNGVSAAAQYFYFVIGMGA